jgi:hypothetical protein
VEETFPEVDGLGGACHVDGPVRAGRARNASVSVSSFTLARNCG